ncbi:accessory factor UbiK family protein [Geminicoccaceae bacterium 1502E]|nr:accessory factor UbiK family protein [Geminicoccaceae bacterium 1502E]
MQTENRLFDDLARVASGALNTLGGLREEIESRVRERVERLANEMDLVSREEFDAVRTMAVKARSEQERLEARVAELEQLIEALHEKKAPKRHKTGPEAAPEPHGEKGGTAAPDDDERP